MPKTPTPLRRKATEGQEKPDREILHLKEQLARALADYANLEKRTEKLSDELFSLSSQRIVKKLLPILDMLLDANKHLKDAGLAIVVKAFEEVLGSEGYTKIEPKDGDKFEETKEEAIDVLETDVKDEDNSIGSTALVGWMQGESIVRPAKVVVKKYK